MIEKISNENNLMRTKRRINMQQNNKGNKEIKKQINSNKMQIKKNLSVPDRSGTAAKVPLIKKRYSFSFDFLLSHAISGRSLVYVFFEDAGKVGGGTIADGRADIGNGVFFL